MRWIAELQVRCSGSVGSGQRAVGSAVLGVRGASLPSRLIAVAGQEKSPGRGMDGGWKGGGADTAQSPCGGGSDSCVG